MSTRFVWCAFICIWICEVSTLAQNSGDLFVLSGESLKIDTKNLQLNYSGGSLSAIIYASQRDNCSADVALLQTNGSIIFERGSEIIITGNRSLAIESKQNITINTTINMTCKRYENDGGQRCLGSYLEGNTSHETENQKTFLTGTGPQWKRCAANEIRRYECKCIPGASHGGFSWIHIFQDLLTSYGVSDFTCMDGGSVGVTRSKGACVGGGAIEIKAEGGIITIDETISASATVFNSSLLFTGCSGGLIRLIASKVEMKNGGSLRVNGANASIKGYIFDCGISTEDMAGNSGGGGGVIQILAPKGTVLNISVKGGQKYNCNYSSHDNNGVFLIKKSRDAVNYTFQTKSSFVTNYTWGIADEKSPSGSTGAHNLRIPELTLNLLLQELNAIKNDVVQTGITEENLEKLLSTVNRLLNISRNICKKENLMNFHDIFEISYVIVSNMSNGVSMNKMQEIFDVYIKIAASVIAVENQVAWKDSKKLPDFLTILEKMMVSMSRSLNSSFFQSCTDTLAVQVTEINVGEIDGYTFPQFDKLPEDSFISKQDFVYIPKIALPKEKDGYKFVILFFKDIRSAFPDSIKPTESHLLDSSLEVASLVMSCTLIRNGVSVINLPSPATLNFFVNRNQDNEKKKKCAFWNMNNSSWDGEGVSLKSENSSQTVCTTTHFTNFAVLMQHAPIQLNKEEELSLLLITYIGCGVSIAALLLAMIVFISMEALSSDRHRIHLNLVIALLLAQILFVTGIKTTEYKTLCKIIAGVLHYSYLVSFMWMLMEGVHLYLKVVKVFGIENIKIKQYYIIGWGLPALIVGVAAIIKPYGYGTNYVCWLSLDDGFVWAFIGPVVAIIVINAVILVAVVKTVVASASAMKSSDHDHIKAGIKGALVLMPLMGITWLFGLLAVNRNTLVFQYVFSIANSLQGFFIFILHVVLNNEVRMAFKRHREKKQLSKESGDYNHSTSNTNKSDIKLKTIRKSTSSSTMSGFGKFKARLSMSMLARTSRVVTVQPINNMDDVDDGVQVYRKYNQKHANSELATTRFNSPSGVDSYSKPQCHSPLRKGNHLK